MKILLSIIVILYCCIVGGCASKVQNNTVRFGVNSCFRLLDDETVITADKNVEMFFTDMGFQVKKVKGLCRANAWEIARSPIPAVLAAVKEVDGDDVDCIVQAGTNLSTADIFPTLEHTLGKPCLSINLVTAWHALRACGINDKIVGKGRLLEEF